MRKTDKVKIEDIILDNSIYPRSSIDHKRVSMFEENMRDGFVFDPIQVQAHPDLPGKYRILDGAHRFQAYKGIGQKEIPAEIIKLNGTDPLLYAAQKAIGPRQLNDEEAKDTARRAYQNNPKLSPEEIGKAIGRARRTVDLYIADLKAAVQMDIDLKIFRMNKLGIPQERISYRLNLPQQTVSRYLPKMATLPKWVNNDIKKGFTISQVAEKHGWPESLVWAIRLDCKDDLGKCHELQWGIRTWDNWYFTDCDKRFGDEWPGRIPAQLVAHILYFFSKENDLVFDPMAGGGVVADTCLAFNRKCWSFDMVDRIDERPEIEPYFWDTKNLKWPISGKTKPDLIIFDPPYFSKKVKEYEEESISNLSREQYLGFLERFFKLACENSKKETRFAMVNADWRDFQSTPAMDEIRKNAIMIDDYLNAFKNGGWEMTHFIQAPMSSERFQANVVAAMQKKRILGVTNRYVV
ncbi:MAG: ParB N-terminal domain-containing protein, partial [Desulfatiglans sp.]|nr:ParB N-terminal domain-containing protein [Desulfatiglans sp.]